MLIFMLTIISSLAGQRQLHLAFRTGQRLRVTVISEVYSAILELNSHGVQSLNPGEATNLVANDAQKLLELTQQIHLLWAAPIQVTGVLRVSFVIHLFRPLRRSQIAKTCLS